MMTHARSASDQGCTQRNLMLSLHYCRSKRFFAQCYFVDIDYYVIL